MKLLNRIFGATLSYSLNVNPSSKELGSSVKHGLQTLYYCSSEIVGKRAKGQELGTKEVHELSE